MDGNGRWAKSRGQVRWEGHSAGAKSVRATVEAAVQQGVKYLTLYAFSVNNWSRPRLEVQALMRLLTHFAKKEQAELIAQGVRVQLIGQTEQLPPAPRKALDQLIQATSDCNKMTLTLALSYGSRQDLLLATQQLAQKVKDGILQPESIGEEDLRDCMTTRELPDVDLLIRTGGESRISDFLLVECAYAELHFTDVMWPEFRSAHLEQALSRYGQVERRFGLTGDQLKPSQPTIEAEQPSLADVS